MTTQVQNIQAAAPAILQLQNKVEQLEKNQVALRSESAQRAFDQDRLLHTARRTTAQVQGQLDQAGQLITQRNRQIVALEGQLNLQIQERNGLLAQLDAQGDQIEANQNGANDLQNRLNAANQRIQALEQNLVDERMNVRKALELSELYQEFHQLKNRVNDLRNCEQGSAWGGRLIGGLLGAFGGPLGMFFGALTGGEIGSSAAVGVTSCTMKSLGEERMHLLSKISQVHEELMLGPVPSELYRSFWRK